MPTPAKHQHPDQDLPRLAQHLDSRRITRMLDGLPQYQGLTTSEINRALYPTYQKDPSRRMEASPGLLLLRLAMQQGWVRYRVRHGAWLDIRDRATIAEVVGIRKEAATCAHRLDGREQPTTNRPARAQGALLQDR